MDTAQSGLVAESLYSLVARALNVDVKSTLVIHVSKAMLELVEKSTSTKDMTEVKEIYKEISSLTAPFKDVIRLRQENEYSRQSPFNKIEKICEDLKYGELIIKVQNGKPVFLESIKKQIKINELI